MTSLNNRERGMLLAAISNLFGHFNSKTCPYCRSALIEDDKSMEWCSAIGCTYTNHRGFKAFLKSLYTDADYTQLKFWENEDGLV